MISEKHAASLVLFEALVTVLGFLRKDRPGLTQAEFRSVIAAAADLVYSDTRGTIDD